MYILILTQISQIPQIFNKKPLKQTLLPTPLKNWEGIINVPVVKPVFNVFLNFRYFCGTIINKWLPMIHPLRRDVSSLLLWGRWRGLFFFLCKNSGFRQEWQIIGQFVCVFKEKVYFCLGKPSKAQIILEPPSTS